MAKPIIDDMDSIIRFSDMSNQSIAIVTHEYKVDLNKI
jgi:hypothetical protein